LTPKASKPKSPKYPKELKTLGDLGLFQRQVAEQIGVDETTIWNWECHKSSPQVHNISAVVRYLGYDPLPVPELFPE
jgi:transcriptional regulator with XRE-family HTH domain